MPKMTLALAFDVFLSLETTETIRSIGARTGLSSKTVHVAKNLLTEAGRDLSFRRTSVRDESKMARALEMLRTSDLSNKAIAAELGTRRSAISAERKRFYDQERARGAPIPECPCGLDLHHRNGCFHRHALKAKKDGATTISSLSAQDRAELRSVLLEGNNIRSVSEQYGVSFKSVTRYVTRLSVEDHAIRTANLRTKRSRSAVQALPRSNRPHSIRPTDDPTYARITALVGKGLEPVRRDDVISEVWLAHATGDVKASCLAAAVKKARSKAWGEQAYGDRSLDEVDQYGRTLLDRLADETDEAPEDEGEML